MTAAIKDVIDAVWKIESARLIAGLARFVRDVGLAEELAQDALIAALEQWPNEGVPQNAGAWLMTAGKRRAIDLFRRRKIVERKHEEIARQIQAKELETSTELDARLDTDLDDDLLRLVIMTCHPILSTEARVALTLRLLCGLSTDEIARAFLAPEATIAQRIVRAKRTLAEKQVPFEVPRGAELGERLGSVLEVIYLLFNEGYAATAGDRWVRAELCEEALRLGRIVAELMPAEPEVHGLVALMELQASRLRARIGSQGEPILLLDQNRALWDRLLIGRGLAALDRAARLGHEPGAYVLQAGIAACHARAKVAAETNWMQIAAIYQALANRTPSPIVELNRAVAVSMAFGPQAGLDLVEGLESEKSLQGYYLLPAVRGDLLAKLGRFTEAREQFERAAELTRNEREQGVLLKRAKECSREADAQGD